MNESEQKRQETIEELKKDEKLLNILRSGNKIFTNADIEVLRRLPLGCSLTAPSKETSPEQEYHDKLKSSQTDDLKKRVDQLKKSIYNKEIELNMIHNILLNRGEEISPFIVDVGYHRFITNTPEENARYGLNK